MTTSTDRELILQTMETMLELQLGSVREMRRRSGNSEQQSPVCSPRGRERKRKSLVDMCLELLTSSPEPIHVDTLVDLLREQYGRVTDRDSLASALAKKAKPGGPLQRVAPATFALRVDA